MKKFVNGEIVDMTPEEEAEMLAIWRQNDPAKPENILRLQQQKEQAFLSENAIQIKVISELTGKTEAEVKASFLKNMPQ